MTDSTDTELRRIRAAYKRRNRSYGPLTPWVFLGRQERERAFIRWIRSASLAPIESRRLIELGCGGGNNLIEFLRLGFRPESLVGNDLIEERLHAARRVLPPSVRLISGNAADLRDEDDESYDVVFQSVMCSSILDDRLLADVCRRMWELAKPGGGVLWYDFTVNNPSNPDVRGIPVRKVLKLFPAVRPRVWRLTLAPPISRAVTRVHPALYSIFNLVPLLRTHVLCWLPKEVRPASGR